MTYIKNTREYYDDFAKGYERQRHHGYHALLDKLQLEVLSELAAGQDVLEVGCGTGLIMRGLDPCVRRIVGIDLSAGMLETSKERGFPVVQGSATELPFADNSFDLVYSVKVLAHVPDVRRALIEMARVLRPGGYLVAELYNKQSLRYAAKLLGGPGKISDQRTEADVFVRWDTPGAVLSYLPSDVTLEHWRGVRVLTPFANVFRIPGANPILGRLERLAMRSPLARFGGFLMAVCKKR